MEYLVNKIDNIIEMVKTYNTIITIEHLNKIKSDIKAGKNIEHHEILYILNICEIIYTAK